MAKIDYYTMMVDINPYEHEGNKYDALHILITFRKERGFYVSWQPVLRTSMGYQTGPMPSTDILVGGQGYIVKEASRNNAKTLKAMADAMLQAKDGIKFLFEQHSYEALKNFICNVSCYGYTPAMQQQLQATIKNENEKKEDDMTPMVKQFYDLKKKHPDALLLFRCGDFYETYMIDAAKASKILGITVTRSTTMKDAQGKPLVVAGFPHHALDTYLPKIIAAGHRVAICDQLEMPKKLAHRGSDELTITENKNTNDQKEEEMKVAINQNETKNVANAQVINNNVNNAPAVEEVEEVVDVTPVKPVTLKRKQSETVSEVAPQPTTTKLPTVTFSTYKTKKGDIAPQIIGFTGEDDPRWKAHKDAGHKWVSASYRRDMSGEKVYCLLFGTRYMDVAKALADSYNTNDVNAWHRAEDACKAVYEQAVRDGKARWAEKKAEWAEKRAAKEHQPKDEKCYRSEDVAKMLQSIMAGGDVPEDIKKLLKAA